MEKIVVMVIAVLFGGGLVNSIASADTTFGPNGETYIHTPVLENGDAGKKIS
jgi:hypothetical protein